MYSGMMLYEPGHIREYRELEELGLIQKRNCEGFAYELTERERRKLITDNNLEELWKDHIKNLCCLCTKLQMRTKNLEVRWCDDFDEKMEYAKKIKSKYYDENNELLPEWQTENMYVGKRG